MVVAALYNIVDQIFIGWSAAGAYGNAATNIVVSIVIGISLGGQPIIGFNMGAGNMERVDVIAAIIDFLFVKSEIKKSEKLNSIEVL